jgi:hypothetical protein
VQQGRNKELRTSLILAFLLISWVIWPNLFTTHSSGWFSDHAMSRPCLTRANHVIYEKCSYQLENDDIWHRWSLNFLLVLMNHDSNLAESAQL